MKIRKSVGIDLGTTNSVIALLDATDSVLITGQDEHGQKTIPSVVGCQGDSGRAVVGRAAAALRGNPAGPVSSVKRHMGLERTISLGPESLTPPQVSARILGKLRELLAATLNDARYLLDSAIITMPAYFNHNQIEATRQAGELAGFDVVEFCTSRRPPPSTIPGRKGTATPPIWSTTWAAAPSMSPSSANASATMRSSASAAIRSWAATTSTACWRPTSGGAGRAGGPPLSDQQFAQLVHTAETVKIDLTAHERVGALHSRRFPGS